MNLRKKFIHNFSENSRVQKSYNIFCYIKGTVVILRQYFLAFSGYIYVNRVFEKKQLPQFVNNIIRCLTLTISSVILDSRAGCSHYHIKSPIFIP